MVGALTVGFSIGSVLFLTKEISGTLASTLVPSLSADRDYQLLRQILLNQQLVIENTVAKVKKVTAEANQKYQACQGLTSRPESVPTDDALKDYFGDSYETFRKLSQEMLADTDNLLRTTERCHNVYLEENVKLGQILLRRVGWSHAESRKAAATMRRLLATNERLDTLLNIRQTGVIFAKVNDFWATLKAEINEGLLNEDDSGSLASIQTEVSHQSCVLP